MSDESLSVSDGDIYRDDEDDVVSDSIPAVMDRETVKNLRNSLNECPEEGEKERFGVVMFRTRFISSDHEFRLFITHLDINIVKFGVFKAQYLPNGKIRDARVFIEVGSKDDRNMLIEKFNGYVFNNASYSVKCTEMISDQFQKLDRTVSSRKKMKKGPSRDLRRELEGARDVPRAVFHDKVSGDGDEKVFMAPIYGNDYAFETQEERHYRLEYPEVGYHHFAYQARTSDGYYEQAPHPHHHPHHHPHPHPRPRPYPYPSSFSHPVPPDEYSYFPPPKRRRHF